MAAVGTDKSRSGLKVCVVGSGTRFVSGISYYTYFLACALKQRYEELVNRYVTDQEAAGYFQRADVVALPYLRSSASGPLAITQACGHALGASHLAGCGAVVCGQLRRRGAARRTGCRDDETEARSCPWP